MSIVISTPCLALKSDANKISVNKGRQVNNQSPSKQIRRKKGNILYKVRHPTRHLPLQKVFNRSLKKSLQASLTQWDEDIKYTDNLVQAKYCKEQRGSTHRCALLHDLDNTACENRSAYGENKRVHQITITSISKYKPFQKAKLAI